MGLDYSIIITNLRDNSIMNLISAFFLVALLMADNSITWIGIPVNSYEECVNNYKTMVTYLVDGIPDVKDAIGFCVNSDFNKYKNNDDDLSIPQPRPKPKTIDNDTLDFYI